MTLGERLKNLRQERGFSQMDLALESGLSQPTICKYENGGLHITVDSLVKVCEALDRNILDVLKGVDL